MSTCQSHPQIKNKSKKKNNNCFSLWKDKLVVALESFRGKIGWQRVRKLSVKFIKNLKEWFTFALNVGKKLRKCAAKQVLRDFIKKKKFKN